jgi:hypothetical protein
MDDSMGPVAADLASVEITHTDMKGTSIESQENQLAAILKATIYTA